MSVKIKKSVESVILETRLQTSLISVTKRTTIIKLIKEKLANIMKTEQKHNIADTAVEI